MSFKERFKGKISTIDKQGNIGSRIPTSTSASKQKPTIPKRPSAAPTDPFAALGQPSCGFVQPAYKVFDAQQPATVPIPLELLQANPYPDIDALMQARAVGAENCPPPVLPSPAIQQTGHDASGRRSAQAIFVPNPAVEEDKATKTQYPQQEVQGDRGRDSKGTTRTKIYQRSSSIPTKGNAEETAGGERRAGKYYELGGLGANVGGDVWQVKKGKIDRMTEYAKNANKMNKCRLPLPPHPSLPRKPPAPGVVQAKRKKQKMAEYAKQIPRPRKPRASSPPHEGEPEEDPIMVPGPMSELERLEMQHNEYLQQVEKLKKQL